MQEKIDPTLLTRVGNYSLRPVDIIAIQWDYEYHDNPNERHTTCSIGVSTFLFRNSDPAYDRIVEILEFVSSPINWMPKPDWLTASDTNTKGLLRLPLAKSKCSEEKLYFNVRNSGRSEYSDRPLFLTLKATSSLLTNKFWLNVKVNFTYINQYKYLVFQRATHLVRQSHLQN